MNHFAANPPYRVTNCREVSVIRPEDITIDWNSGVAFISSLEGAIYGLDLKNDTLELVNLTQNLPSGIVLHPHGISLYQDRDGENRLFAVNHPSKHNNTIEIFAVEPNRLRHLESISDQEGLLVSPNDIVAVGREQFYVTNDSGGSRSSFMQMTELLSPRGSVLYYDGNGHFTKVADRIAANGIAVDRTHKRLYVAAMQAKNVLVYQWEADHPSRPLEKLDAIGLGTCPDNLEWDQEGDLWIGCHRSLILAFLYIGKLIKKAPSQVIRFRLTAAATPIVEEVFRDDGKRLSASSVAAFYSTDAKQKLLIGSLDDHFLICDLHT
jgi:arylesterase/paraoxonase